MKIDTNVQKKYTLFNRIQSYGFFILIAIFLFVVGIFSTSVMVDTKDYVKIKATIVEQYDESETLVRYEVDGEVYESWLSEYSSFEKIGGTKTIRCNPDNPYDIQDNSLIIPLVSFGGGIASLTYAIFRIINDPRKDKEIEDMAEETRMYGNSSEFSNEFYFGEPGVQSEYYFRYCGKMNQSHVLETPDRKPIMEAKLVKFSLLGECDYEFINHLKGTSVVHKVGKTVTSSTNNRTTNVRFSLDAKNVWDFIHANDIDVETEILDKFMNARFIVKIHDKEVGMIKTAGTAICPGVKSNKFSENLAANGLYKVYADENNIGIMFLVTFALARSNDMIHD